MIAGVAWAILLLVLWMWGREVSDGGSYTSPVLGDVSEAGRFAASSDRPRLPDAHEPLRGEPRPTRLEVGGSQEPLRIVGGGEKDGATGAKSAASKARWDSGGPVPGAAGTARLTVVGSGSGSGSGGVRQAAAPMAGLTSGAPVRVARADGSVAEFTVSGRSVVNSTDQPGGTTQDAKPAGGRSAEAPGADPRSLLDARRGGGAGLTLVSCDRPAGPDGSGCATRTEVHAYLTGSSRG